MRKNTVISKVILTAILLSSTILNAQNTRAPKALVPPAVLRPDIKVEHVMAVAPESIRILYDESTKTMFFTCYDGEVYRINNIQDKHPVATL
jgi:hypothetical protein